MKVNLLLLILVFYCSSAKEPYQLKQESITSTLQTAHELLKNREYTAALNAYQEVCKELSFIDELSRYLDCKINIGNLYFKKNQTEKASSVFREVIELSIDYKLPEKRELVYNSLALIELKNKNYKQARNYLKHSLLSSKKEIRLEAMIYQGIIYKIYRQYRNSERMLLKATESAKPSLRSQAYIHLSQLYLEKKQLNKAIESANQAKKIDAFHLFPSYLAYDHRVLSKLYEIKRNYSQAIFHRRRSMELSKQLQDEIWKKDAKKLYWLKNQKPNVK